THFQAHPLDPLPAKALECMADQPRRDAPSPQLGGDSDREDPRVGGELRAQRKPQEVKLVEEEDSQGCKPKAPPPSQPRSDPPQEVPPRKSGPPDPGQRRRSVDVTCYLSVRHGDHE